MAKNDEQRRAEVARKMGMKPAEILSVRETSRGTEVITHDGATSILTKDGKVVTEARGGKVVATQADDEPSEVVSGPGEPAVVEAAMATPFPTGDEPVVSSPSGPVPTEEAKEKAAEAEADKPRRGRK